MLFQIKSYLTFLWHSKNEHAVHSPFVFTLITKCFYDKKPKEDYLLLEKYRQSLLENTSTIEVSDFGAGSLVFKSNTRAVAQIAKTAGISVKRAQLLYRISVYFQFKSILEIGTSLGLATSALALGSKLTENEVKITTLEGCPNTMAVAKNQLQQFKFDHVDCITTQFDSYLKNDKIDATSYDLIYFDGNHSEKATLAYFELLIPTITNDSVWIFDDIHWSADMEAAWETIKQHPKVTVTIDTYQWGLVFFRREQPKEHFIIRT
ncbi:O-methyltransferase [Flavobacterium algicola]|uniref:O-methyltransferase n=1 Tax=Flavobacterium algicola TaxID=556529 RepID=UPI001EFC3D94|nr:class I SAM-dependent methyltransferase [Flavobacterium algicola]MCG9793321.1 class I SAM-dependent methyltransferase [Flavobacterium algicola]